MARFASAFAFASLLRFPVAAVRALDSDGGACAVEGERSLSGHRDHMLLQVSAPSRSTASKRRELALAQGPIGWQESAETSGDGEWCQAHAPAADWNLKRCSADGDSGLEVKALTYNLYWWNLFGEQFRNGNGGSAGKLIEQGGSDAPYDFMAFQECEDVDRVLGDAGLAGSYGSVAGDHAVAIAYRKEAWTLLDEGMDEVAEDRAEQWWGTRGAQWARFQHASSGKTVFLANHHGPLPVGTGGRCGGQATAWNILKTIGTHAHEGDGIILVGDFNSDAGTSTVQELGRSLHKVYTGTSFGGIDHVFSNCGEDHVRLSRNLGSGGSDHDALEVLIQL